MPYKDKEKQREYQRKWKRERRERYFSDKECAECGSTENLELDHIDPDDKGTHKIWSFSKKKREKELEKCQVLCSDCHKEKTVKELQEQVPRYLRRQLRNSQ